VDAAPGDLDLIARLSREYEALGVYVFALDTQARGTAEPDPPMVYARCFAPAFGLDEDPVTGSASGALGCYLARCGVVTPAAPAFVAEQGTAIGRSGRVRVTPVFDASGAPSGVVISDLATPVFSGHATIPPERG
jgi:PhzF family phenazine biosynthesis protein